MTQGPNYNDFPTSPSVAIRTDGSSHRLADGLDAPYPRLNLGCTRDLPNRLRQHRITILTNRNITTYLAAVRSALPPIPELGHSEGPG